MKVILKYKNGVEKEINIEEQSSHTLKIELQPATYYPSQGIFEKKGKKQIFYFSKIISGKPIYIEKN